MLICPDVHCNTFYKPLLENKTDKIIFLGDYEDPYPQFDTEPVLDCLMNIFSFAQDNSDRVKLLIGNHSWYYFAKKRGYSRYDWVRKNEIEQLYDEFRPLFKIAYWDEETQTLFTHAGVTLGWLNACNIPLSESGEEMANTLNSLLFTNPDYFECVSRYRGGYGWYGSSIWADVNEHLEDEFPFKQVFGHTALREDGKVIHENNWWMCDSRKIFEYNEKELKLWEK